MLSPNELTRILQDLDDAHRQGLQAALATVVLVTGSAYRRPGARMLVRDDGRITGGVSGGCLERDVTWKACAAMRAGRPSVVHYLSLIHI